MPQALACLAKHNHAHKSVMQEYIIAITLSLWFLNLLVVHTLESLLVVLSAGHFAIRQDDQHRGNIQSPFGRSDVPLTVGRSDYYMDT
jgi:hypothetical protein